MFKNDWYGHKALWYRADYTFEHVLCTLLMWQQVVFQAVPSMIVVSLHKQGCDGHQLALLYYILACSHQPQRVEGMYFCKLFFFVTFGCTFVQNRAFLAKLTASTWHCHLVPYICVKKKLWQTLSLSGSSHTKCMVSTYQLAMPKTCWNDKTFVTDNNIHLHGDYLPSDDQAHGSLLG